MNERKEPKADDFNTFKGSKGRADFRRGWDAYMAGYETREWGESDAFEAGVTAAQYRYDLR